MYTETPDSLCMRNIHKMFKCHMNMLPVFYKLCSFAVCKGLADLSLI